MYYDNFHFWGMHLAWWIFWSIFILWIFATPYDVPGQRLSKSAHLDIIKKRFAYGQISKEEYLEMKDMLQSPSK